MAAWKSRLDNSVGSILPLCRVRVYTVHKKKPSRNESKAGTIVVLYLTVPVLNRKLNDKAKKKIKFFTK